MKVFLCLITSLAALSGCGKIPPEVLKHLNICKSNGTTGFLCVSASVPPYSVPYAQSKGFVCTDLVGKQALLKAAHMSERDFANALQLQVTQ